MCICATLLGSLANPPADPLVTLATELVNETSSCVELNSIETSFSVFFLSTTDHHHCDHRY